MDRRAVLKGAVALGTLSALGTLGRVGGAPALRQVDATTCTPAAPFSPPAWLKERHQGLLTTRTLQSDKPLWKFHARTRSEWEQERVGYLRAWRELIGPWPAIRPPLSLEVLEQHDEPAYVRYKIAYSSLSSNEPRISRVRAWLLVPKGYNTPRPAVVTMHQTIPQGKDEPAGVNASLPWLAFADYYAQRGYVTLAPDTVGYGERTMGCYAEQGFELADAWPILSTRPAMTLLGLMLFDVSRAVDAVCSLPSVDASRVAVMGHSEGGFLTNFVLPLDLRIKVGIASCGWGTFRTDPLFERWASATSAYLPRLWLYRLNRDALPIDTHHVLALAAPRAHLIEIAMGDTVWTPAAVWPEAYVMPEVRRIHGLYGRASEFVKVIPGGAAFAGDDHGWYPEAQAAADALLARELHP